LLEIFLAMRYHEYGVICMTTGQRIKDARKKAGMTQAELADKLNIPFQSVSQWERDIRNPKKETLEKLADIFGCYYFELYGDEEGKEVAALMREGMRLGANIPSALTRMEVLAEYQKIGYAFTSDEAGLVSAYNRLNATSQIVVLSTVKTMAHDPKYSDRPIVEDTGVTQSGEMEYDFDKFAQYIQRISKRPSEPSQSATEPPRDTDTSTTEPPAEDV